jgi:hypothetical protein
MHGFGQKLADDLRITFSVRSQRGVIFDLWQGAGTVELLKRYSQCSIRSVFCS